MFMYNTIHWLHSAQEQDTLLDLNILDNTTINATGEYFDMDQVIFLFNDTVEYFTPNTVRCGNYCTVHVHEG